jgi:tRNA:m(5)U-54 methyltransferase
MRRQRYRAGMTHQIHIVGGGLAGSEAAWQLAEAGLKVRLSEMRGGGDMTPAHHTDGLAELVCSNSFRSDDADHNAVGLLHAEMRALDSLIMAAADAHRVPAGSALAVDRDGFSAAVTERLAGHPNVELVRIYAEQLETPEAQLQAEQMKDLAAERPSALLCFERDPAQCHRSLLREAVLSDWETVDLYPGEA